VGTSSSGFEDRGGVEVGDTQVSQVVSDFSGIFKAKAGVELDAISGVRNSHRSKKGKDKERMKEEGGRMKKEERFS